MGDEEVPFLGNTEVLVKVNASSQNYHDLLVVRGLIPTQDNRVPLSDCGGQIVATGRLQTRWNIGDNVISCCYSDWVEGKPQTKLLSFIGEHLDGYATEYIAVEETSLTVAPKGWSALESATLPCAGLTAWRSLVEEGR